MSTYFIVGATGHQGGAVAHQLLDKGHSVRAIVRNISSSASSKLLSRGAKLFQGDYHDAKLLATALEASAGVFINPYIDPTDVTAQVKLCQTIIEAAKKTGTIKHIVVSTAFQTGRYEELLAKDPNFPMKWYYEQKYRIEQAVKELAQDGSFTWTIVRPSWLMFDYLPPQGSLHFPELYTPTHELGVIYNPGARMPQFSEDDLGAFSVAAFEQPERFHRESIELSNEALTPEDVARELSKAGGVEVKIRQRSEEEKEAMWSKVPTQGFHALANWVDLSSPKGHLDKYGIKLTTLAEYLEKYREVLTAGFAPDTAQGPENVQAWGIKPGS